MSLTTWEINNHNYELDLSDAEVCERYETAFEHMIPREKALPKDGKASDYIKASCALHHALYDELFGEGAGVEILGERQNLNHCNDVYLQFLDFVAAQQKSRINFRAALQNRYSPERFRANPHTGARKKK